MITRLLSLSSKIHLLLGVLLLVVTVFPLSALAQEGEPATANAEAREQFGAMIEEAGAMAEMSDGASLIQAAMKYIEAANLAAESGDTELAERANNTREQAVKAYVDAGSAFAGADDHAAAAEAFDKAAEVSAELANAELEAKAKYNASVAYVSLKDFENALAAINRAIELAPTDLNYLYVKGVTLRGNGDMDSANTVFTELEAKATEAGDEAMASKARDNLGRGYLIAANETIKSKKYQDAISQLDMAKPYLGEDDSTLNTLYANAYYRLGVDQVKSEQLAPAESNLKKAQDYGRKAGKDQIVQGAQQQLDYIKQLKEHQQQ